MFALLACLLALTVPDATPPEPLPDTPPGIPGQAECERLSWQVWGRMLAWQDLASSLPEGDRAAMAHTVDHLTMSSWAWWHAGKLQDPTLSEAKRRGARLDLIGRIGEQDYRAGKMPEP